MIRPLPEPPARNDALNFAPKADALLAALPGFVEDCNALESTLLLTASTGTSTTTLTVGVGAKSLTTQTGKAWFTGGFLFIASASNPANIMQGQVTSYDPDTGALVVAVVSFNGSGSASSWLIGIAGIPVIPMARYSTGEFVLSMSTTAPTGTLAANGQTIGSASSGGTARAHADTEALFTVLWNSTANTELIIQTSGGSNTTRGASAAADFAANKRMPLPSLSDGEALVASVASAVAARTAGANLTHSHTITVDGVGDHQHTQSVYVGANVDAGTTANFYAMSAVNPTGGASAQTTLGAGNHTHTASAANSGGTKNLAAGVYTRIYIAL